MSRALRRVYKTLLWINQQAGARLWALLSVLLQVLALQTDVDRHRGLPDLSDLFIAQAVDVIAQAVDGACGAFAEGIAGRTAIQLPA